MVNPDAARKAIAWLLNHAQQARRLADALKDEVLMHDPRRFHLQRDVDVTGASGTGRVADGVLWPDGSASLRWRGEHPSTVHWDNITSAERVHGHGGATRIVWLDDEGQDQ